MKKNLSNARYVAFNSAFSAASSDTGVCALNRRGFHLGWIKELETTPLSFADEEIAWKTGNGCRLPAQVRSALSNHRADIDRSLRLMQHALNGDDVEDVLASADYVPRLEPKFVSLGSVYDEGDAQEIVKVDFDVIENNEVVAENVWVKCSWLSFNDDDTSLRFRFSFGMEQYEDVAADYAREIYAAQLAEAIFPECAVITQNTALIDTLKTLVGKKDIEFVERIIYFNAPNGGAQFHQDVERGHLGVVFAQLHGRTAWFSISKQQLVSEIDLFLARDDAKDLLARVTSKKTQLNKLLKAAKQRDEIATILDSMTNDAMEALLNRVPEFAKQLVDGGFGNILNPGDVMLLPQDDIDHCAWHSVFCLDEYPGHALSFAIREKC